MSHTKPVLLWQWINLLFQLYQSIFLVEKHPVARHLSSVSSLAVIPAKAGRAELVAERWPTNSRLA
jgi:hypothetical protein